MKSRINKILEDAGHGIKLNSEGNITKIRGAAYFTVCDFTDATVRRFAWAVKSRSVRACVRVRACVLAFASVFMSWIQHVLTTYAGHQP